MIVVCGSEDIYYDHAVNRSGWWRCWWPRWLW